MNPPPTTTLPAQKILFGWNYLAMRLKTERTDLERNLDILMPDGRIEYIEFAGPAIDIHPNELSSALISRGINNVGTTWFFGDIDPLSVSPIDKSQFKMAQSRLMDHYHKFIEPTLSNGFNVVINGPLCFKLEHQYDHSEDELNTMYDLLSPLVAKAVDSKGRFRMAVEWLNGSEDVNALAGPERANRLVRKFGVPRSFGTHDDTFHMRTRHKEPMEVALMQGENSTVWHLSGVSRYTPGYKDANDDAYWTSVRESLQVVIDAREKAGDKMPLVIAVETFGDELRRLVPSIGGRYPKDIHPRKGVKIALDCFERAGIIPGISN